MTWSHGLLRLSLLLSLLNASRGLAAFYPGSDVTESSQSSLSKEVIRALAIPVFGLRKVPGGYRSSFCTMFPDLFNRRSDCNLGIETAKKMLSALYNSEINLAGVNSSFNGINTKYPSKECRLLSVIHGIAGRERPSCWYNPKVGNDT